MSTTSKETKAPVRAARRGVPDKPGTFKKQIDFKKEKCFMALVNGATYRLQCRADSSRSLNVYGTTPTSLANVCLYKNDDNDICQQWVYKKSGTREYFVCKGNQNLALDLYTGSSSTANVKNYNAHVYAPSETSYVKIKEVSGGYIFSIRRMSW